MRRAIFILILALFTTLSGVSQDTCNVQDRAIKLSVCFSNDLERVAENHDFAWNFPYDEENYRAITIATGEEILIVFRRKVNVSTITHELSHVKDAYKLGNESGAKIVTAMSDFIYESAEKFDIDLFYTVGTREVNLTRDQ